MCSQFGKLDVWSNTLSRLLQPTLRLGEPADFNKYQGIRAFDSQFTRALTGNQAGIARVWDLYSGKPISSPMRHEIHPVYKGSFSPDGQTILTLSDKTACLWSVAGQLIGKPLRHSERINNGVFSFDSKKVATASADKTVRIWDATTGSPLGSPLPHPDQVYAVAFSPDNRCVLTGGFDRTARLWDCETGRPVLPDLRHHGEVWSVAFTLDGKTLLTDSSDKNARLWDRATGDLLSELFHPEHVLLSRLSSDGTSFVTTSDDSARIWQFPEQRLRCLDLQHPTPVNALSFNSSSNRVFSVCEGEAVRIWNAQDGSFLSKPVQLKDPYEIVLVSFSRDRELVLIAQNWSSGAEIWETTTGKLRTRLPITDFVIAADFSWDGQNVLTANRDQKTAQLWCCTSGKPVGVPLSPDEEVNAVALGPNNKIALTASDGKVRLWDLASGKSIFAPQSLVGLSAIRFSPDGTKVVLGGSVNTALLDINSGTITTLPTRHQDEIVSAGFSPDGAKVFTSSIDNSVCLWDVATGKPYGPPLRHNGPIPAVAFSPDGLCMLTGSADKTARFWETATGKALGRAMQHLGAVRAVAFSPDAKMAVTGGADHRARLWRVPTPVRGDPNQVLLWAQVVTGLEIDDQNNVRVLDPTEWCDRRDRFEELGGLPDDMNSRKAVVHP